MAAGAGFAAHHLEHGDAAGAGEAVAQCRGEDQEDDVQDGGVVTLDGGLDYFGVPSGRGEAEAAEDQLGEVPGGGHGGVEGGQDEQHHLGAVVLPVDHQDRHDDQVGEDERDDAAEADAAVPQHRGEGDVADRADEAQQADDRADQRPPQFRRQRVAGEEQVAPEAVRHPGGARAGDQQAERDVADDGGPLHHEDVRHRGEGLPRPEPVPQAALGLNGHVHRGVAFHRSGTSLSGLGAGGVEEPLPQQQAEQQRQQDDHDRATGELGQGELPAHQQRQDDAELDNQGGGGDLEAHGGGEAGAPTEQRPGQRHGGIGAR